MTPRTQQTVAAENIQQESVQQLEPQIGKETSKGKCYVFIPLY